VPLIAAIANIPGERHSSERVFFYASGGACKDPWHATIKRARIKRLTPHCCRHGFATGMLQAGVDIITVADKGGWKSPAQLFKTYGHARTEKAVTDVLIGKPLARDERASVQVSANIVKSTGRQKQR
jgi:integrase